MAGTIIGMKVNDPMDKVEHKIVMVGTVSTPVVSHNEKRRSLVLINDSNAVIYIAYGVPASLNFGIRLNANGGEWMVPSCCQFAVNAISSGTNKRLLVSEGS